jgi:para-nitrobenzyl esterase
MRTPKAPPGRTPDKRVAAIEPRIRTTGGVVRGRWENSVAAFRGIPYAEPPIGPLRFRAPVEASRWDGTRDALAFGPPVPQANCTGSVMTAASGSATAGSADCLTLNIWSPDLAASRLPVMVWIHGGTYLAGSSSNPHHDGETLARAGVVMVSMNYRTGVEGFAHIADAPDNRGILDQAAALRWVQDNIAGFGGDPGNVTVFGQSAGAGCTAALLAMPMAAGLFRRAIAQSMPGTYFSPRLADAITSAITSELGVRATIDDIASIPPRALLDATDVIIRRMPEFVDSWGPMALTPTPFSPVVDGDLLPQAPWRALAGGAARDVDLLVGHTRDEYRLYVECSEVTDDRLSASLDRLAPSPDGGRDYRAAYPEATPSQLYELVNADWLFRMPCLHLADAQCAGNGKAWTYELCWGFNSDEDASHSLDFLLVLGTLDTDGVHNHPAAYPNAAAEAVSVSRDMRTDWVNFATNGDPGWARYDPDTRLTRVYQAEATTQPYPEDASRRIWSTHQFDTLDLVN